MAVFSKEAVSGEARREMRAVLGISPEAPVVTMASRLLYDKGVAEFVEAARVVKARRPDAVFVLAGARDPTTASRLRKRTWRPGTSLAMC